MHCMLSSVELQSYCCCHSQRGSVLKGCFLLSVALVDWLGLLTTILSLLNIHSAQTHNDNNCGHYQTINAIAVTAAGAHSMPLSLRLNIRRMPVSIHLYACLYSSKQRARCMIAP